MWLSVNSFVNYETKSIPVFHADLKRGANIDTARSKLGAVGLLMYNLLGF